MSFYQWTQAVLAIGESRGLDVRVSYVSGPQGQQWATFNWRARNGSRYGSSGAGAEFIGLTSPAEFTWDWYALPSKPDDPPPPPPPPPPVPANPWERHGRFVPRVPAMAVSDALNELFRSVL